MRGLSSPLTAQQLQAPSPRTTVTSTATANFSANVYDWDAGSHDVKVEFVGDDAAKVQVDGDNGVFTSATISGASTLANIDLFTLFGPAVFNAVDPGVTLDVTVDGGGLDETGDILNLKLEALQTASIIRQGGGGLVTGITLTGATTTLNLSDANFVAGLGQDMGISLEIDQADQSSTDNFIVELDAIQEAEHHLRWHY